MKASSVRDARPAICRPCIPEAVEGGGSIPGHNYLELRFTSNSTQLLSQSWRPALSVLTAQSHMYDGGEGTSSVLFQWRPAFSALWRRGNSVVSVHHINNFWNTRSNLTKFSPRYQRKTLRRRCHNVGSVFCINNFWSNQSNSAKFTGQLP